MMRNAGVTAFDFFGLLLPGTLLVVAALVFLAPLIGPLPATLPAFDYADWIAIALICYVAGHLAQLFARLAERLTALMFPWGEVFRLSVDKPGDPRTASALHVIRDRLQARSGLDLAQLPDVVLSNLTDEFLEQYGNASTLASYRSREVYYRGVSAATVLLAAALIECAALGAPIVAGSELYPMSLAYVGFALISLFVAYATGDAFRRQRRRRMRHSLLGYLVLESGGRLGALPDGSRAAVSGD